jgi:Arc/MetJ-type ribon-helix-helix transcriptional regulator
MGDGLWIQGFFMNNDGTFRFRLPKQLEKRILEEQERSGISRSEIIRYAIAEYLDRKEEKAQRDAQRQSATPSVQD